MFYYFSVFVITCFCLYNIIDSIIRIYVNYNTKKLIKSLNKDSKVIYDFDDRED